MKPRTLTALTLALLSAPCTADTAHYVQVNGLSQHSEPESGTGRTYNSRNYGIGWQRERARNHWVQSYALGWFTNSFNEGSAYASTSYAWRFGDRYHTDIGALVGIMTNPVHKNNPDWLPMLAPIISFGAPAGGINVIYLPKIDDERHGKTSAVLFFQLKIPLTPGDTQP